MAGFHAWLGMGRHVRKGERGIAILASVAHRSRTRDEETGDETVVVGAPRTFRVAHVFRGLLAQPLLTVAGLPLAGLVAAV